VNYGVPSDASALQATMQGLAVVTQLQDLHIRVPCCVVAVAALLPLTGLKALTDFAFTCNTYEDDDDVDDEQELYLHTVRLLSCLRYGSQHALWASHLAV
jgi:hypothetical protein